MNENQGAIFQQLEPLRGQAKYNQIKQLICDELVRLQFRPGDRLWTENELVDKLGVSMNTVRRSLDELVREGLIERHAGKGTFLKRNVFDNRRVSNRIVFLSVHTFTWMRERPYFGPIVDELDRSLREAGYELVTLSHTIDLNKPVDTELVLSQDPAGIILPYYDYRLKPYILGLQSLEIPLLLINEKLEGFAGAQFYFDDFGGGKEAAQYLIDKGHRALGIIKGRPKNPASDERAAGFLAGALEAGIEIPDGNIVQADFREETGYAAVEYLIAQSDRPTAVFCCHDFTACGALKKIDEHKLRVPRDMAVMGFCGFPLSPFYYPKLTTMKMDLPILGRQSAQWLIEQARRRAENPSYQPEPFVEKLPVQLIEGQTA